MASRLPVSSASLRICVLQLPALLRRGAEPPAGADAAAAASWIFEKKLLQMHRIAEALYRTLDLLKERSAAEALSPFVHTFKDNLLLPDAVHSAAAHSAAVCSAAASPAVASSATASFAASHSSAAADASSSSGQQCRGSYKNSAHDESPAAARISLIRRCLQRLPAATAAGAMPFDLLVLPEMWSCPYHSSCFSKYSEELSTCIESSRNIIAPPSTQTEPPARKAAVAAARGAAAEAAAAALEASEEEDAAAGGERTGPAGPAAATKGTKAPGNLSEQERQQQKTSAASQHHIEGDVSRKDGLYSVPMGRSGTTATAAGGDLAAASAAAAAAAGEEDDISEKLAFSPAFAFMQALAKHLRVYIVGGSLVERARQQQETGAAGSREGQKETAATAAAAAARESLRKQREGETGEKDQLYNTCCVFDFKGNFIAKYRKSHLFDVNILNEDDPSGKGIVFQESCVFSAGNTLGSFTLPPFGNIGIGICYDLRFPEYALALAQQRQCHLLCYPGAFNQSTGPPHWALLLRARALDNELYVVGCSPALPASVLAAEEPAYATTTTAEKQLRATEKQTQNAAVREKSTREESAGGGQATRKKETPKTATSKSAASHTTPPCNSLPGEYPCYGHSMVVGPWGDVIAQLEAEPGVIVMTAAMKRVHLMRKQIPIYHQKRFEEIYSQVTEVPVAKPSSDDHATAP